ncbi:MAG: amidohydrolase family protein [Sphingomonadales bacterium]|nr:amidohydrolase family protein [Sphingomonadales bacterium]MDE2567881.1 amidohydrolase family protein [Sphingomonadales bacterium]
MLRGALALLAASASLPALAADVAFTNATVVIGDGSAPIEHGTVVLRDGKVLAAGANVSVPAGATVVDAAGKWVTPGLVVAVTDLGLLDVGAVSDSNDTEADKSVFNAALDVSTAIDPDAMPLEVSRAGGVTRAAVIGSASTSIFAGQGAYIDLAAGPNAIDRPRAFQFVELGERGAALAGGSRLAAQAMLRNALREAREIAQAPAGARRDDVLLTRSDAAALVPVVTGRQPLFVHVERAADIRQALALKSEYPALDLVIVGAAEGWRVAGELAAARVPVITQGVTDLPGRFETMAATQSNVGRMVKAGVRVAIGGMFDNDQPRYAPQYAGNLVGVAKMPGATGLTWGQAFAAISSVPAAIMGEGAAYGSLLPGRAGDVVVWDGDPLEVGNAPLKVYIDGVEQPVSNHQTRLRERYRHPAPGALPKAYDW